METPDQIAISRAKTEFRDAYNEGNVERLMAVFADEVKNWSEGDASFYGTEGRRSIELQASQLFARYQVDLFVIIIDIVVHGDFAYDYGWHKFTLTDKRCGEITHIKYRYHEHWAKQADGEWKLSYLITNKEHPPRMLTPDMPVSSHAVIAH
jgi:ketosteroid isomerase-like protein